jgi:methionyl-tRNA synthetase
MGGVVPDYTKYSDKSFEEHEIEVNTYLREYIEFMEATKLRAALTDVLHISA